MPSSYTPSLKLILQATGENNGSWGTLTNSDFTSLVDVAVAGYVDVPFTSPGADQTLSNGDGAAANQARYAYINMSSAISAARNVIVPTASKIYLIKNSTTGGFAITVKTAAGTGISVPNGKAMLLLCDGTNVVDAVTAFSSLNVNGTLSGGTSNTGYSFSGSAPATSLALDTAGRLGIGTASPGAIVEAYGFQPEVRLRASSTQPIVSFYSNDLNAGTRNWAIISSYDAYGDLVFRVSNALGGNPQTAGTTAMTLNTSGNLGIGVTPSAWSGISGAAFEIKGNAYQYSTTGVMSIGANAYFNGTNWIYKTTQAATRYEQVNGQHQWSYAASGTAGNAISFTQAMTLDTSGNLGLGVTPGTWSAAAKAIEFAYPTFGMDSAGKAFVSFNGRNSSGTTWVYKSNDPATLYTQSASHTWYNAASGTAGNPITFTQAMTLDSNGALLLGDTTVGPQNTNSINFNIGTGYGFNAHVNHIIGTASTIPYFSFNYNAVLIGSITQSGTTAVLYNTTSDYRLKSNQQPLENSGAFIDALKPTSFVWTSDGRKDVGFIAHEFQEVAPSSVTGVKDEVDDEGKPKYQAMQAGSAEVIANLVAELQSLRKRIATLESK